MDKELEQKFDEILSTVKLGFDEVSDRLEKVEEDMKWVKEDIKGVKEDIKGVKEDMKCVKEDIKGVKSDVGILKTTMITKDYLDDKMADLGAEIGKRINRALQEQRSFSKKLIEFLKVDGVLKQEHISELEEMLA